MFNYFKVFTIESVKKHLFIVNMINYKLNDIVVK